MISSKYAWPAAGLLLVALVPTLLNVYRAPEPIEPGSLAADIPQALGPFARSVAGRRKREWVKGHFGADDFVSRRYGDLTLFAARTYDGKKLFHFPELALTYGRAATDRRSERYGEFPAHVLEYRDQKGFHLSAYALFYGDRPVEDPISFMLSILPERFLGKREPMTIIYVQGDAGPEEEEALTADLEKLLAAAGEAYLERS